MTVQAQIVRNPYVDYGETVREILLQILSRQGVPVSARLFSLSCFAFEADAFLYPDSPDFTEETLAKEIDRVTGQLYEKLWLEEFSGNRVDLEAPMSMLQSLFLGQVRTCRPAFKEMILAAWSEYIPEEMAGSSPRLLNIKSSETEALVKCAGLTRQYVARRERLYALMGGEIEEQLQAFCIRFIQNRDYTHDDTLLAYVQRLMLHVVLLKYFLVSDPDLAVGIRQFDAVASGTGGIAQEDRRALARAVFGIIERVEFHAAHETGAMAGVHRALQEQGMQTFAQTARFIQF